MISSWKVLDYYHSVNAVLSITIQDVPGQFWIILIEMVSAGQFQNFSLTIQQTGTGCFGFFFLAIDTQNLAFRYLRQFRSQGLFARASPKPAGNMNFKIGAICQR